MDVISLILGFIIGVVVVGIAVEFGTKKKQNNSPSSKHIPKNTKIIVNKYKDSQNLKGLDARKNKEIKGNYIIGDDRALILAGPLKKDEVGFWTVEKEIVEELNKEFFENWAKSSKLNFD